MWTLGLIKDIQALGVFTSQDYCEHESTTIFEPTLSWFLKCQNASQIFFAKIDQNLMKCFGILKTRTNEPIKWVCWKFIYQTRGPNPLVFKMPKHRHVFFWSILHFFFVRWFGILKTREEKGRFEKHITLETRPRCRFEANLTCHLGNTAVDHMFWGWSHPWKKWI